MTEKIHSYVESISAMNRDLEEKVKERTREVVEQKEEIETQKEEIEAQLDLATLQRDTISKQMARPRSTGDGLVRGCPSVSIFTRSPRHRPMKPKAAASCFA